MYRSVSRIVLFNQLRKSYIFLKQSYLQTNDFSITLHRTEEKNVGHETIARVSDSDLIVSSVKSWRIYCSKPFRATNSCYINWFREIQKAMFIYLSIVPTDCLVGVSFKRTYSEKKYQENNCMLSNLKSAI